MRNAANLEPIQYANVWTADKLLASSDSLGEVWLYERNLREVARITAIGYKTLDTLIISATGDVFMDPEPVKLKQVVISSRSKVKKHTFGKVRSGNLSVCAEGTKNISEMARFFTNDLQREVVVDQFKFKALCSRNGRVVMLSFYSVGENGQPGNLLNREPVICALKKGMQTYKIDLAQHHITMPPEGLFAAVSYPFIEANKQPGKNNKDWYFYEPFIEAEEVNSFKDCWYLDGVEWKPVNRYTLLFELVVRENVQ
ncbi:MAG: hypothetical protein EOO51_00060 [Flavobacterium sp.]|nr:MAG: hypothetical protein EOO51_00060 [Flavobacterium sp.]